MFTANRASNNSRHRAPARVQVSRDRTEAVLTIEQPPAPPVKPAAAAKPAAETAPAADTAAESGAPQQPAVTGADIDRAVSQAGVRFGLDEKLLEKIKADPQPGDYVIAHAKPPEDGMDGSLVYHFSQSCNLHPKELADGRVDYRHLGIVQNVRKGDMLCTALPPTEGTPGTDVTGAPIRQQPGRPAELPVGENTASTAGGTALIAALSGQISMSGSRINVYPTYVVNGDVDFSTGHIDFVGNVHVCGSVHEGFTVKASGNVEVDGMVDGGSLNAGGDILIHQGAVGRNLSVCTCVGNFVGNFIESCTIDTGGDVTAASMMHCNVSCAGSIRLVGSRARIIGGVYLSGGDIDAGNIGSPSGALTELRLGEVASLKARSEQLGKELEVLRARKKRLDEVRVLVERKKGIMKEDERQAVLRSSQSTIDELEKELADKEAKEKEMTAKLEQAGNGRIFARGSICRGTRVVIGGVRDTVHESRARVVLRCKSDQILIEPLTGEA